MIHSFINIVVEIPRAKEKAAIAEADALGNPRDQQGRQHEYRLRGVGAQKTRQNWAE